MLESFAWIVCKVLWLQWTKHERSVSFFLYSFLIKLTLQGYRQCKLSSLLYFVVSLAAGLSEKQVVIRCTCCSSCFPYISKKPQQGRAAFPENAARKSCSLLFPFQQACITHSVLSRRSIVISCTCCFSCFPYISKKTQQEAAA